MDDLSGCQIPCLLKITEGTILIENQPLKQQLKRLLAKPWNYHIKNYLKKFQKTKARKSTANTFQNAATLNTVSIKPTFVMRAPRVSNSDDCSGVGAP